MLDNLSILSGSR